MDTVLDTAPETEFLIGGGEMGRRIAAHDWAATPLGNIRFWPAPLRTALGIVLNAREPMYLAWGPELLTFYNDAFRPLSPSASDALGRGLASCWAAAWPDIGPIVARATAGEPSYIEDLPLTFERDGHSEPSWWTLSCSPVRLEDGTVGAVIGCLRETAGAVLARRHQVLRLDIERCLHEKTDPATMLPAAMQLLLEHLEAGRVGYLQVRPEDGWDVAACRTNGLPPLQGPCEPAELGPATEPRTILCSDAVGRHDGVRAYAWVPLLAHKVPHAFLFVHWRDPRSFCDETAEVLEDVATRIHDALARNRAEAAARQADTSHRLALEAARLGDMVVNIDRDEVTHSPRLSELFGYPSDKVMTIPEIRARCHPEDEASIWSVRARVFAGEFDYYVLHHRVVWLDGSVHWLQQRGRFLRDSTGRPVTLVAVYLDETERQVATIRRAALDELSDRFRTLETTSDLSYAIAEVLGRTLEVSRAGYGTLDKSGQSINIERDWSVPGIPSLAGELRFRSYGNYIEDLRQGCAVVIPDAANDPRSAGGAERLSAIGAQALVNVPVMEGGKLVAILYLNHWQPREWTEDEVSFVREVAERTRFAVERRRAEAELRESEGRLRQLNATLEARVSEQAAERDQIWRLSRDALLITDTDGVWLRPSPAWTEILGWTEEELVGRTSEWMEHPDDRAKTRAQVERLGDGDLSLRFENRFRAKDGRYVWFSWTAVPKEGRIFCVARDVTAEKEAVVELTAMQDQLRQSQKMEAVGQLTGGIAHDFNNLLGAVVGSLDLIRRRPEDVGRVRQFAEAGLHAAERGAKLTGQLLAFSRAQRLELKPLVVADLVGGMRDLLARTLGPMIRLGLELDTDGIAVLSDPTQLEMAVLNLAINARDAMQGGGELVISTCAFTAEHESDLEAGDYVELSVADTGSGMEPDVVARAFDPFFTTKGIGKGTGLGLSQVYGVARQAAGTVRIESDPGRGTTIRMYLPRTHALLGGGDEPARAADAPAARTATVLVVDDDPDLRQVIAASLETLGFDVQLAADGPSGIAMLELARPDLLIVDFAMPGMNGAEFAAAVHERWPDLKLIFASGYAETAAIEGVAGPHAPILRKPFRVEQLREAVTQALAGTSGN